MTDVAALAPISTAEAGPLLRAAYDRLLALLHTLPPEEWHGPTDCAAWDVRDLVGHLAGNAKFFARKTEMLRQQSRGLWIAWRKHYPAPYDGTNDLQVREHAALSDAEALAELERVVPLTVAGRARMGRAWRALPFWLPGGIGWITLAYLYDHVMIRDVVMHSFDIAHPRGLDVEVDPRVVEDVVAEWARRHGKPFTVVLDGVTYTQGSRRAGPGVRRGRLPAPHRGPRPRRRPARRGHGPLVARGLT